jgi:hypothetical protein
MILYTDNSRNLESLIINRSKQLVCDEICILSAYIGVGPILKISEIEGIKVNIVYGLATEGAQEKLLDQLRKIHTNKDNLVSIYYPKIQSHAKIYLWKNKGDIIYALNGSANFSSKGLLTEYRELLSEVNKDDFREFQTYYDKIFESSLPINNKQSNKISTISKAISKGVISGICETDSLFANKSKINWGHSDAHTNPRDAYIPLRKKDILNHPELFPPKSSNKGLRFTDNEPIDVIWDDGTNMVCLMEGTNVINGLRYPNKISTYKDKKKLGDYLRRRMKLKPGSYVTKNDFKRYGRDTITITKISDGVYYFDFSI